MKGHTKLPDNIQKWSDVRGLLWISGNESNDWQAMDIIKTERYMMGISDTKSVSMLPVSVQQIICTIRPQFHSHIACKAQTKISTFLSAFNVVYRLGFDWQTGIYDFLSTYSFAKSHI